MKAIIMFDDHSTIKGYVTKCNIEIINPVSYHTFGTKYPKYVPYSEQKKAVIELDISQLNMNDLEPMKDKITGVSYT